MLGIGDIWLHANGIIRSARRLTNEGLEPLGLSSAEGNILITVLTQAEILNQDAIVGQLDISRPAVSRALESLERKGFITRRKDPRDRRANLVIPTAKARAIGPSIERIYDHIFTVAAEGVPETEARAVIALLATVSERLSAARIAALPDGSLARWGDDTEGGVLAPAQDPPPHRGGIG